MRQVNGVAYGTGGGRSLVLDLLIPGSSGSGGRPAVLYAHGGGWAGGDRSWNPNQILAHAGFVTASISYRFTDVATFPAQIHDVKAAIRWMRASAEELEVDPARIGLWGHSAGGHLAALAAVTAGVPELEGEGGHSEQDSSVQAVVPIAAPLDFLVDWYAVQRMPLADDIAGLSVALLGGSPAQKRDAARAASPLWHVDRTAPPHLLIHGEEDDVVPISQARAYVSALRQMGQQRHAELIALPGVGHMSDTGLYPGNPDPYRLKDRVVEFFGQHLGR